MMNPHIISLIQDPTQVRGISANIITGSCGAYFFNSLFEGHPEILPINIHAISHELEMYYYYYVERFPKALQQNVDHYLRCIDSWNITTSYCGTYNIPTEANRMREIMRECFLNLNGNITHYHLYYIQYIALAAVLNYPLETKNPIIFQHRHRFYPHFYRETYAELNNDFYINYIRLIRRPEKSLDQIFSHTSKPFDQVVYGCSYNYAYPILYHYYDDLYKYFPPEKLFCVRFEDLHLNTEETLRACCAQMGIRYIPEILLTSTMYGKAYEFERPTHPGIKFTGFSKERGKDITTKHISWFHKFLLQYFLEKFYLQYKYKDTPSKSYKLLDYFFWITWILPLIPTCRELKIIAAFYWCYLKNPTLRATMRSYNNFINTIGRRPFFEFLALDKSPKERFIIYKLKPFIFWFLLFPIFHFLYLKLKVTWMLLNYRFNPGIKFAALINTVLKEKY